MDGIQRMFNFLLPSFLLYSLNISALDLPLGFREDCEGDIGDGDAEE